MAEMTPQKALEILEMFLHKQCDLQRTEFAYSQKEVYMAVSMAKYALEKPIQETTEQEKTLTLAFGKDGKARVLNEEYTIYCADEETFEKVKSAVEKQMPKKVEFLDNGEELICPCCGFDLMGSITDLDHDPPYCFECGQKLSWERDSE